MQPHTNPRWTRNLLACGYALSLLVLLGAMTISVWSIVQPDDVPFWRVGLALIPAGILGGTFFGMRLRRELAKERT